MTDSPHRPNAGMSRRSMLSGCAAVSLAFSTTAASGIDPFVRSKPGRLRLSLAAYSLRKYLTSKADDPGAMNLFEFVDYCHELGISGTELTSYYFPTTVTDEYLLKLKRHCHLRGMTISGGAIRNDFCSTDPIKVEQDLSHTKKWVDHYALLGVPAIRIFAGNPNSGEPLETTLKRCAKNCETASAYAAGKGVLLALENHGGVTAKAEGLIEIVKQVDSSAFGVNFDSGNFHSSADPYQELAQIAPYAVNAQIKVEISHDGQRVAADLPRIVGILRDAGYSGWVALEYEADEDPLAAIPRWIKSLKPLMDG